MATGRGFQAICGVANESTWGTVVAAAKKLPFISETFDQTFVQLQNAALVGVQARQKPVQGARNVQAGLLAYWTYDLIQPVLKHFFGTHTVNVAADDHYDMEETLDGKSLTVAIDKQVSVHEYAGVKISELTLSGSPGDAVRLGVSGTAKSRSITSSTNTTSTLAALAEPGTIMQFHDLALWIGDLADALTSGDAVQISKFDLKINRNLEAAIVNSQNPLEALENGFRDGLFTIEIPRYTTDQYITWQANHTSLQAMLTFTRSGQATKTVRLPLLVVTSNPIHVGGPGLMPTPVTFSVLSNKAAENTNTGMTFTDEIRILEADGS